MNAFAHVPGEIKKERLRSRHVIMTNIFAYKNKENILTSFRWEKRTDDQQEIETRLALDLILNCILKEKSSDPITCYPDHFS